MPKVSFEWNCFVLLIILFCWSRAISRHHKEALFSRAALAGDDLKSMLLFAVRARVGPYKEFYVCNK